MSIGTMSRRSMGLLVALILAAFATAVWMSYVHSLERKAVDGTSTVQVFVAKDTIPAGTSAQVAAQRGLFMKTGVPKRLVAEGAVSSLDTLNGRVVATTITKGEQIVRSRFTTAQQASGLLSIPPDHQAMTVQVDTPNAVGGFVQPHDHISVIAKIQAPQGPRAQYVFQNIEVLAVDTAVVAAPAPASGAAKKTSDRPLDKVMLTLSLTPAQAEQLAFVVTEGNVFFTLLPAGAKQTGTPGRTADNLFR